MATVQRSLLSVSLMTGLFCGLLASVIGLFFDVIYRFATNFPLSEVVNVSSIIFVTNIIFLLTGLVFFALKKFTASGNIVFIVLTVVLAGIVFYLINTSTASDIPRYAKQYREILNGLVLIMLLSALMMPLLATNKKFEEFFL